MTTLVQVRDLQVRYGRAHAVDGVDLTVGAGTSVGLLGANGAGKSTIMRVLAGLVRATGGQVRVAGHALDVDPAAARAQVGYCPDVGGLIPRASAWEHLTLAARVRELGPAWRSRAQDLLQRFDLTGAADTLTASYSHGMARRLSVLLAVLHEPPVVLLDEPFDGVDPVGVEATLELIAQLRERGAAVLISSHLLPVVSEATSQAVVLRAGRIVAAAPSADLAGTAGAERYRSLLAAGPR